MTTRRRVSIERGDLWIVTNSPLRHDAVRLLGEIGEGQVDRRDQIIGPLVSVLKDAVQQTKDPRDGEVLSAIAEVAHTGNALLKCGPEARDALTREVLPRLKDLQFHKSEQVRRVAETLRTRIEESQ